MTRTTNIDRDEKSRLFLPLLQISVLMSIVVAKYLNFDVYLYYRKLQKLLFMKFLIYQMLLLILHFGDQLKNFLSFNIVRLRLIYIVPSIQLWITCVVKKKSPVAHLLIIS